MAIDPSIALGVKPISFANKPFEGLRDVLAIQESRQRMQATQQRLDAQQREQHEAQAVQQILQETQGDWHAALPRIRQVAPMASIEIEKQLGEMRTRTGEAAIKAFELEEKQEADTLSMFQFVRQNPQLYGQMLPLFQERVKKLPKEMWPDPADPQLEQKLSQLAQVNISVIDQAKANQENVRLLLKGDLKGLEGGLATVDDAAEWDGALEKADVLLQLPRGTTRQHYGDYSPEKVAALQKGETGGAFTLSPGSKRFDANGRVVAEVPPNEGGSAGFTLSPGQVRYGPDGQPIASRPASGGQSDAELVDAIIANPGIYANLTPTIKSRISAALAARGFKFENAGKPSTGQQKRALNFFNRAKQADDELQQVEGEIAKLGLAGQARLQLPNVLQSQTGQAYNQAQRAFTEARLRKDSGAAIPEHEYANDRRTYFAQPGDSPATIAQKARGRAAVLASLGFEAGPGLQEFYGEEAPVLMDSYRQRSSTGSGGSAAAAAAPDLSGLRPGTGRTFREGPYAGQTWTLGPDGQPKRVR